MDWSGIKVLIIDDEADQASLNTLGKRHKLSPTYKQLLDMRDTFPHHAYLQYTATPQAPLLVAINDVLSPDFVRVINPGSGYVGGPDYFEQTNRRLVRVIDESDLEMADDPNGGPPESLLDSFRLFIVGCAAVLTQSEPTTRSMLIHPSRVTAPHATFVRWIRRRAEFWLTALRDEEYKAGIRAEFLTSWTDLRSTDPDLPSFEECWAAIRFVLRGLQVVEMNAREGASTPVIEWDNTRAYVLVGGQALDRGFTVEGLAVTYMPRGPGVWNADSIQQRARFFGYKRSFLGQCRVFLDPQLRDAFENYVEHERHMLDSLTAIQNGSESLKDWERQFYLDPAMKATRQSVISIPMIKVEAGQRWIYDPAPISNQKAGEVATAALEHFLETTELEPSQFEHLQGVISVQRALELLESLPNLAESKLPNIRGLKLQLAKLADNDSEQIRLFYLRPKEKTERTVTAGNTVQPFQGASKNYPGDRSLTDPDRITLQIHKFAVRTSREAVPFAEMVVPAFWIPERLAGGWLLEEGGA
ncbi:hypothetical protein B7R25_16790 [Subtercola boreus]|uniref:Putative endonuclease Z1 domain-containing protein n=2 Tax=Subtercola boreus TaxID=120213 RepID=A0A3E0W6C4_9MICO|nr:hypothetical protein B7R23_16785 [Subtercola boreus]RFA24462.1 hypothetical protein B7R25_16790 [Subtercola boreus]